jgi:hypothetical protein
MALVMAPIAQEASTTGNKSREINVINQANAKSITENLALQRADILQKMEKLKECGGQKRYASLSSNRCRTRR